jgi:hypothetical protein
VFVIQTDPDDENKSYWHRCGVAFVNKDGSLNVKLDLFPNVSLQIRDAREKERAA